MNDTSIGLRLGEHSSSRVCFASTVLSCTLNLDECTDSLSVLLDSLQGCLREDSSLDTAVEALMLDIADEAWPQLLEQCTQLLGHLHF